MPNSSNIGILGSMKKQARLPLSIYGWKTAHKSAVYSSLIPRLSNYCVEMQGREREPGIHCKFTHLISRELYGFVNSP